MPEEMTRRCSVTGWTDYEAVDHYRDELDEEHPPVTLDGVDYAYSFVLELVAPGAFQQGLIDLLDAVGSDLEQGDFLDLEDVGPWVG